MHNNNNNQPTCAVQRGSVHLSGAFVMKRLRKKKRVFEIPNDEDELEQAKKNVTNTTDRVPQRVAPEHVLGHISRQYLQEKIVLICRPKFTQVWPWFHPRHVVKVFDQQELTKHHALLKLGTFKDLFSCWKAPVASSCHLAEIAIFTHRVLISGFLQKNAERTYIVQPAAHFIRIKYDCVSYAVDLASCAIHAERASVSDDKNRYYT